MQISCIYKITSPTKKIYIGSTINYKKRIKHYRNLDCKAQVKLYNSLIKYGFKNHIIEILEVCNNDELYRKERYYGELYDSCGKNGLNLSLPGYDDIKPIYSIETKLKKSISQSGIKNNFYGRKHTEETKKKISKINLGRKHSEEVRKKVSQNNAKHNSKIVIDLENGIFYNSAKEASIYKCIPHSTLRSRLNGGLKNITLLRYSEK
jgi:group I intron endonuclease